MAASRSLTGKRIAILVENGFEQVELTEPRKALDDAGAQTKVVSPVKTDSVRGWKFKEWGDGIEVDLRLEQARATDFDALLLPGGVINPDKLRLHPAAIDFIRAFGSAGKPIAAICHGPWTLIDAGLVKGRTLTSWPSLRADLGNAGANWVDRDVVVDGPLVTSRKPDDIPAFNREMVTLFAGGVRDAAQPGVH